MKTFILAAILLGSVAIAKAGDIVSKGADGGINVSTGTFDNLCVSNGSGGAGTCGTMKAGFSTGFNVGIGKQNPSTALDVNGTVTALAFAGPFTSGETFLSSVTILGSGGLGVTYGVAAGSATVSGPITIVGSSLTIRGTNSAIDTTVPAFSDTPGASPVILIRHTDNSTIGAFRYDNSHGWLNIDGYNGTAWASQMTFDRLNTRIGINDSSPDGTLDIISNAGQAGFALSVSSQNDVSGNMLAVLGNGNTGVGTASPASPLTVFGASGSPSLAADAQTFYIKSSNGNSTGFGNYTTSPYAGWIQTKDSSNNSASYPLVLNPLGGNVGIGITQPNTLLHMSSGTLTIDGNNATGVNLLGSVNPQVISVGLTNVSNAAINTPNAMYMNVDSDSHATGSQGFHFGKDRAGVSGGYEFMTIFPSGNVSISSTTEISTATLHVAGSVIFDGNLVQKTLKSCTTGTQTDANGLFSACVASDRRLKKNIVPLAYDPLAIDRLKPVTYYWKDPKPRDANKHLGFVAQDVEQVYPNAVVSAGEDIKGIDSNAMIAALVIEVQQLRKRVAALEKVSGGK